MHWVQTIANNTWYTNPSKESYLSTCNFVRNNGVKAWSDNKYLSMYISHNSVGKDYAIRSKTSAVKNINNRGNYNLDEQFHNLGKYIIVTVGKYLSNSVWPVGKSIMEIIQHGGVILIFW